MKTNLVKLLLPLGVVLLFQAWMIKNHSIWFAEFPEQLSEQLSFSDQANIIALNAKNEIVWYFSKWIPDSVEKKFYQISIVRRNQNLIGGNTLIDKDVELNSVSAFVMYLPRALQFGLLSPWPRFWTGEGSTPAMTMARKIVGVTTVFFYICLVGLLACVYKFRHKPEFIAVIVICFFGILLYSYTHPNAGTLLRYRYGFYMLLVAFGAANIVEVLLTRFNVSKSNS